MIEPRILKIFEAVIFGIAFCFSPAAYAHEFDYSVSVYCDQDRQLAKVGEGSDIEEGHDIHGLVQQYNFDTLPKVACDFGPNKKVLMLGQRWEKKPNNDVTELEINKPSNYSGSSLWMQFSGYIEIRFDADNGVHIKNCAKHPGENESTPCKNYDYKTTYTITSLNSPSFDCKKAVTVEEILICDDPALSNADREMSKIYHQKLEATKTDKSKFIEHQKAWKLFRGAGCFLNYNSDLFPNDAKKTKECLLTSYRKRINQLKNNPSNSD